MVRWGRGVEAVEKNQTLRVRSARSVSFALLAVPNLPCDGCGLSAFKATYRKPHQRDRNGEIRTHPLSAYPSPTHLFSTVILRTAVIQLPFPDLAGPPPCTRIFFSPCNHPVQYPDRGRLPGSNRRGVPLKVIRRSKIRQVNTRTGR